MNTEVAQVRTGSRVVRPNGLNLDIDTSIPALILKVGQYPLHVGGLGAIRTLGRLGVPVYTISEPGLTPAVASRYCTGRFVRRTTVHEPEDVLVADLRSVGTQLGRRSVIVPTDDEAAVLAAEHAAELSDLFLLPSVPAGLPRRLASKPGLAELCRQHDIPCPASVTPAGLDELKAFAATATFPVVIKNAEPWERRRRPVVPYTMVVRSRDELLAIVSRSPWGSGRRYQDRSAGLILQEFIPDECSRDWGTDLYCTADASSTLVLTGLKVRTWPPVAGATSCGYSVLNPEVAALAERFCKEIGFSGIADLDWRLDLRDGQYKLVDFNPRLGSRFRLSETESGVDVVRAMHLDLTGREVPRAPQIEGKRIVLEHVDVPARITYRLLAGRAGHPGPHRPPEPVPDRAGQGPATTEFAWMAADDPLPFLVMLGYAGRAGLTEAGRQARALALRLRTTRRWTARRGGGE